MTETDHPLVQRYLRRLRRAAADLPAGTRNELLDNVQAHLAETTAEADEAGVRTALDELGTPEEVAAAARAETEPRSSGDRLYDIATVFILFAGGFAVPVLGWIAGVVMLWNGPRWTRGEKILGTAALPVAIIIPAAAFLSSLLVPSSSAPTVLGPVLLIGLAVVAIGLVAVFVHLLRAAARVRT
ncbi:hypothetical protein DEF23_20290 [Marinitenerispora sediminis]|uniref:Uncharacterized protein n=2 Tax=Marinitenerispora sediminis TaxID=1931232 RepID=A0A368T4X3_9ACTN|nr:hypothetical protein DEF28_21355 [Marinitenerispora sediminis]RCV51497.1 hypothetical protein DEF23_20290 [Marinitenerispora sediminis]RCV53851.1 hypothetical protein DEF24_19985 [Marinitenerispora sediminis]